MNRNQRYLGWGNQEQNNIYYAQNVNNDENPFNTANNDEQNVGIENRRHLNISADNNSQLIYDDFNLIDGSYLTLLQICIISLMILATWKSNDLKNFINVRKTGLFAISKLIIFVMAYFNAIFFEERSIYRLFIRSFIFSFFFGTMITCFLISFSEQFNNAGQLVSIAGAVTLGVTILIIVLACGTHRDSELSFIFVFFSKTSALIIILGGFFFLVLWILSHYFGNS